MSQNAAIIVNVACATSFPGSLSPRPQEREERDPGNEVVACAAGVNGEGVPSPPFFLLSARSPFFTPFTPATQATTVGTTAIGALLQNAVLQNTTIIIIIGVNHKRR